jgi:hypothetical protein
VNDSPLILFQNSPVIHEPKFADSQVSDRSPFSALLRGFFSQPCEVCGEELLNVLQRLSSEDDRETLADKLEALNESVQFAHFNDAAFRVSDLIPQFRFSLG